MVNSNQFYISQISDTQCHLLQLKVLMFIAKEGSLKILKKHITVMLFIKSNDEKLAWNYIVAELLHKKS